VNFWTLCLLLGVSVSCGAPPEPSRRAPQPALVDTPARERPELVELRSLWPAAMKTVETAAPVVDVSAWQPAAEPLEAALFLPESSTCSPLIISRPDAEGVTCRVVTHVDQRDDGHRHRSSVACSLSPELVVDYGHQRDELLVAGKWQATEEGLAVPAPERTYGVLTSSTPEQLTYAGERVTPIEGCVGEDLRHCSDVVLPAWRQCRACNATELFFVPRPQQPPPLQHWPDCLNRCPNPPHQPRIERLGDLGLWRRRSDETLVPRIFRSPAACRAHVAQRQAAQRKDQPRAEDGYWTTQ
jgi:hypothetical protein